VRLDGVWRRLLLAVPLVAVLISAWVVVRWCIGNTLAEFPPNEGVVHDAARLAPDDPQVYYSLAVFARNSFTPGALEEALAHYERATSLSPNDYRLWLELGRVRGQAGDAAGGERALRRAVELAPSYAMPRWYLGNLLLRAGRQDEAFAELRRAAEFDPQLRPQIFALAWNLYGGDAARMRAAAGESAQARAQLAEYLIKQKRADDAIAVWSALRADEKKAQRASGEGLMRALFEARRFHAALDVYRSIVPESGGAVSVGQFLNGGFEKDINAAEKNPFDWEVRPAPQVQMGIDTRNPHGGGRSLRLLFNSRSGLNFNNVSQLVVVEPSTRYRLEFFIRTSELKSATSPVAEVIDRGEGGRVLAASAPAPADAGDWQQVSLDFTTPAQAEAVTVQIVLPRCPEGTCPIFGRVWYDDFSLQRIGADSGANRAAADGDARLSTAARPS
jgi:Tfp pilus assembly protein PilF